MGKIVGGILVGTLALWLLWAFQPLIGQSFISQRLGLQWDLTKSGPWGDTFGALNTLFAALGFTAVVLTLRQQQQQIRASQENQQRQQEQIKAAQDDQHRQRFESSYFELLKLFRELRNELHFKHTKEFMKENTTASRYIMGGASALRLAWKEALHWIDKEGPSATKERVAEIYDTCIHKRYENSYGPYFRILYTILYRIHTDHVLTDKEKHRYGNLLRSQLTSYELAVVGLNGLSKVSKDFGELVTEFRLLKYIPKGERRTTLSRYYPAQAFEPRD